MGRRGTVGSAVALAALIVLVPVAPAAASDFGGTVTLSNNVSAPTINIGVQSLGLPDAVVTLNGRTLSATGTGYVFTVGFTQRGTLIIDSGSVVSPTAFLDVGRLAPGVVTQTGGTATLGFLAIGDQALGSYAISGGALTVDVGNGNTSLPNSGILVGLANNATLTISGTGGITVAQGPNQLVQIGTRVGNLIGNGTVNLDGGRLTTPSVIGGTGVSTFNFNGGTLQANGDSQTFLQGLTLAQIRNGGAVIDTNGATITIGQTLVHSTGNGDAAIDGGLTATGGGTLTLTGALSYTGRTVVDGVTLALGDAINSVTLPGDATVTANQNAQSSLVLENGSLGAGRITNQGIMTLGAQGLGPATAGTSTIANTGVVNFFNASTAGNATITNADPGPNNGQSQLQFFDTSTAGNATIVTENNGTTFFTANSQGGTSRQIVNAGGGLDFALLASGATSIGSLEGAGLVGIGFTNLTIGGNNLSTTFSGTIQNDSVNAGNPIGGNGGITKVGTGTLILSGTNTYSGDTNVNGGTLQVDGRLTASNVIVNTGGTLSGTGKIGDPTINAGATLSPGNPANPYGTLTIGGPLTIQNGATYRVAIDASGRNSKVDVVAPNPNTGTAVIQGGAVSVAAANGSYAATRYTILTAAGGVTGRFASVATDLAFLVPTLAYDANNVYLDVTQLSYTRGARTRNQTNVASGLDTAVARGAGGPVLTAFNTLTAAQAPAAFDAISGEGIAATQNLGYRAAQLFTDAIADATVGVTAGNSVTLTEPPPGMSALALPAGAAPVYELADLPASAVPPAPPPAFARRTWRVWASGYGGVENFRGDPGAGSAAQRNNLTGGQMGVDYALMPNYIVGVAIGGSSGDFSVPTLQTTGSTSGGHVALYDVARFGAFYAFSSSSFSYFGNKTTRVTGGFGGLASETARGNFDSHEFRSHLEFGRHLAFAGGTLTPFVALELAQLRSNGFTEGTLAGPGLLRLAVSGQSQASVPGFVGARFTGDMPMGGLVFRPSLEAAWVHDFAPQRTLTTGLADLPGATFLVEGARPAWNAARVKTGGELALGPSTALFASFDGEFSGLAQFYAGTGGLKWAW